MSVAVALVVALACGCTTSAAPAPVADTTYGAPIEINTPQGLRAKQTIDMLNSDWPIGTVGVRTMAAPDQVNGVTSAMGNLWLDRPITVSGIDIGAGQATLNVLGEALARDGAVDLVHDEAAHGAQVGAVAP